MKRKEKALIAPPVPAAGEEIGVHRTSDDRRRQRREKARVGLEAMLGWRDGQEPPEAVQAEWSGDQERRLLMRHEWAKPDPSTVWRGAAGVAVAVAAGAIFAAITVSEESTPKIPLLWAIGIGALVVAAVCGAAHFDVNRGRKAKHYEIVEERRSDDG